MTVFLLGREVKLFVWSEFQNLLMTGVRKVVVRLLYCMCYLCHKLFVQWPAEDPKLASLLLSRSWPFGTGAAVVTRCEVCTKLSC